MPDRIRRPLFKYPKLRGPAASRDGMPTNTPEFSAAVRSHAYLTPVAPSVARGHRFAKGTVVLEESPHNAFLNTDTIRLPRTGRGHHGWSGPPLVPVYIVDGDGAWHGTVELRPGAGRLVPTWPDAVPLDPGSTGKVAWADME